MNRITVLGGGAWGTALAVTLMRAGRDVTLWARDAETVDAINGSAMNRRYLPGIKLNPVPATTGNLAFVSQVSLEGQNEIRELPVRGLSIERKLAIIARQGDSLSPSASAFAERLHKLSEPIP